MTNQEISDGAMLNFYPDSLGGKLSDAVRFLQQPELGDAFSYLYILPSLFNTDLDRGFSVKDYGFNPELAAPEDLDNIKALGLSLKLDFILNHASVLSPQFQDLLENGENSKYADFFINWNKFWENCGKMTDKGYIQPDDKYLKEMFFRKLGLPLLMVEMPNGQSVPYWNTFYQQINENEPDLKKRYLGQMDLNTKSPLVWDFYDNTLQTLSSYGAKIVRLDAFAYASKELGKRNFLNEPEIWDLLSQVKILADKRSITLLPEIHASYSEKIYLKLSQKGYIVYDFFLPGLVIDALEHHNSELLALWATELAANGIRTVNMLGCHDGIPLLDLKGLVPDERILALIDLIVSRGGYVKNLHGQKNVYYQVNATYYSALGEDDRKMLLARALQIFMPGKPQVWYLDLFAGKNDHQAVIRAGRDGHKEINRTNLTAEQIAAGMEQEITLKQLKLLRFRNACPAFGFDAHITASCPSPEELTVTWENNGATARLNANLAKAAFDIIATNSSGQTVFQYESV
ncbi:MAG: glycosidase [Clostridiales bacterium]|jgi:sucrose phosphorylase|nr:glycosidase [Clostridiales bacterium]